MLSRSCPEEACHAGCRRAHSARALCQRSVARRQCGTERWRAGLGSGGACTACSCGQRAWRSSWKRRRRWHARLGSQQHGMVAGERSKGTAQQALQRQVERQGPGEGQQRITLAPGAQLCGRGTAWCVVGAQSVRTHCPARPVLHAVGQIGPSQQAAVNEQLRCKLSGNVQIQVEVVPSHAGPLNAFPSCVSIDRHQ